MGASSSASMAAELKRVVMEELLQGRDSATKLQLLLPQLCSVSGSGYGSVHEEEHLVLNILRSFTNSLSLLAADQSLEASQAGYAGRRSEDSAGDTRKRLSFKDKRGCSKKRKNVQEWTTTTSKIEDGQAWRKYGQKLILNAKHPRAYFRCKHKFDQGCGATKQVQRLEDKEDGSQVYKTTYIGTHTCRNMVKNQKAVSGSGPIWDHHHHHQSNVPVVKEESKDVSVSDNVTAIGSVFWPDVLSFDESSDHPLIACSDTSSQSLDMDMDFVVDSVDFDSVSVSDFRFDEDFVM